MTQRKRIIVGVSGATGSVYAVTLLDVLKDLNIETHLVITKAGKIALEYETEYKLDDIVKKADYYYNNNDIAARISSGSFLTDGMIIAPCTVKTMSEIATGVTTTLISRAADVVLKERRRLVLMFRETPIHLGHIKTMESVTQMGGIIMPPVMTFYNKPNTIQDMVNHSVGRVLDLFNIEKSDLQTRWDGM